MFTRAAGSPPLLENTQKPSAFNCLLQMIFCDLGHLHNEHMTRHEAKVKEHWQGPIERARVNNLNKKWVVAQMYEISKLTFYDINRDRRLGLSLSAGVATD